MYMHLPYALACAKAYMYLCISLSLSLVLSPLYVCVSACLHV